MCGAACAVAISMAQFKARLAKGTLREDLLREMGEEEGTGGEGQRPALGA